MFMHGMALERKENVSTLLSTFLLCFLLTCLSLDVVVPWHFFSSGLMGDHL